MKAVITVIGKDGVGIIARVSKMLAEYKINIIDITQTTYEEQFLMVMVVDMKDATVSFAQTSKELKEIGEQMGQKIHMRHKKVFDSMHRI